MNLKKLQDFIGLKGKSRILDDEYTIEKDKTGQYKTVNTISKNKSERKEQYHSQNHVL